MKLLVPVIIAVSAMASPASAAYLFQVSQTGDNVVVTGSGSLNLAGLTNVAGTTNTDAGVRGSGGLVVVGTTIANATLYSGFSGPANIGPGISFVSSPIEAGRAVGLNVATNRVFFDPTYVSGTQFGVSTATFTSATIASLGLTAGTYVYSFGTGGTADNITVQIDSAAPPAVPEPATWGMMIMGFGAVGFAMRRRQKANARVSYAI